MLRFGLVGAGSIGRVQGLALQAVNRVFGNEPLKTEAAVLIDSNAGLTEQQAHTGRINHVHCKDVRPAMLKTARERDMSFMDAVLDGLFTVPGDGSVDYPTVLKRLSDCGFMGWLVVEASRIR
ncbi:MAG: hypothetical protein GY798_05965 [Hyphomicrobiales bacterium]|nr:hypothetical protein [Hyphomicrobiales bacterium]